MFADGALLVALPVTSFKAVARVQIPLGPREFMQVTGLARPYAVRGEADP